MEDGVVGSMDNFKVSEGTEASASDASLTSLRVRGFENGRKKRKTGGLVVVPTLPHGEIIQIWGA
jgi:hypothetical protein